MTKYRIPSCRALAAVLLFLAAACGGSHRPPAVTGQGASRPTPRPGTAGGRGGAPPVEPVDSGPEVVSPLEGSGLSGADIDSGGSPEGGPLADIHFDFNLATLSEQARATLEKHALWLQNHRDARVTIEGHCDERGTREYNLALGERRANAVRSVLIAAGISSSRISTRKAKASAAWPPAQMTPWLPPPVQEEGFAALIT